VAVGVGRIRVVFDREQPLGLLDLPLPLLDDRHLAVVVVEVLLRLVGVGDPLAPAAACLEHAATRVWRVVEVVLRRLAATVGEAAEGLVLEVVRHRFNDLAAVLAVGPRLASCLLGGPLLGLLDLGLFLGGLQLGLRLLDRDLAAKAVGVLRVLLLGLTDGHLV